MIKNRSWVPRDLVDSPVYIGLCINEKQFKKEMKILGCTYSFFLKNKKAQAETQFMESDNGKRCAIINLGNMRDYDEEQVYSILVHEIIHVWQYICETIGEDEPSSEFEAYSIQSISQNIFDKYKELVLA